MFSQRAYLAKHLDVDHDRLLCTEIICLDSCSSMTNLKRHLHSKHDKLIYGLACYESTKCTQKTFHTAEEVIQHMTGEKHKFQKCEVEDCNKLFSHKKNKDSHEESHGPRQYCEKCMKNVLVTRFQTHVKSCSKVEEVVCDPCGKKFTNMSNWLKHMKLKHSNDPDKLYCDPCEKYFTKEACFLKHMSTKHEDANIDNEEDKSDASKPTVGADGSLRYCFICNKCYDNLKSHQDEVHKCQNCNGIFDMLIHQEVCKQSARNNKDNEIANKYACTTCNKTFDLQKKLKEHKLTEHSTKTFECDHCQKTFQSSMMFSTHMNSIWHEWFETPSRRIEKCPM